MLSGHQWLSRHGLPMVTVFRSPSGRKTCCAHYSWLLGKELLVVSPTAELLLLDPALPNQSLAFGTEGGWAWACFPLKEWQIGQFLRCHTEPSQKREWEMSGNSDLKSPGPKEVITLPCLTYLYCPVQMSPWYWCSPSCNFSWMRVHMKNIFHRALVWKHLVF